MEEADVRELALRPPLMCLSPFLILFGRRPVPSYIEFRGRYTSSLLSSEIACRGSSTSSPVVPLTDVFRMNIPRTAGNYAATSTGFLGFALALQKRLLEELEMLLWEVQEATSGLKIRHTNDFKRVMR
ncbi:hypothetical protein DL765_000086 [Monosporascus sp. GIB2]|nr:hypothetical protein DL765_000086 [Monosporascus sp. GIB2]